MQALIFTGLQASGKSSFYKERFFDTYVRISLDLLRTRHRERELLRLCLQTQQRFVIDNTNPTAAERSTYITAAREHRFQIIGYNFVAPLEDCLARNAQRKQPIPTIGLRATAKKLSRPEFSEGYDLLYDVQLTNQGFAVEERTP